MEETKRKTLSYNPSEQALKFIKAHTSDSSFLNMSGLIEVAVRFLAAWPEEKLAEIIGNAVSEQKLKAWVEDYVKAVDYLDQN